MTAKIGKYTGLPWGWQWNGKRPPYRRAIPCNRERRYIRIALILYMEGKEFHEIIKTLASIKCRARGGTDWNREKLRRALRDAHTLFKEEMNLPHWEEIRPKKPDQILKDLPEAILPVRITKPGTGRLSIRISDSTWTWPDPEKVMSGEEVVETEPRIIKTRWGAVEVDGTGFVYRHEPTEQHAWGYEIIGPKTLKLPEEETQPIRLVAGDG